MRQSFNMGASSRELRFGADKLSVPRLCREAGFELGERKAAGSALVEIDVLREAAHAAVLSARSMIGFGGAGREPSASIVSGRSSARCAIRPPRAVALFCRRSAIACAERRPSSNAKRIPPPVAGET